MIEQNYNLDTIPFSSAVPVVHVSQYDSGSRTLKFKLLAGGSNYDMTGVTGAQINGKKPDGTEFSYNMTISNDVVSIVITEQMAAVAGRVMAEVVLTGANSSVLGTANFIIEVEESPIDEGVISDTDVPIIMDFVTGGTPGQIFKRTATGGEWVDDTSGGGTASDITYDNTDSGLTATDVQDAIDETVSALNTGLTAVEDEVDAINSATSIEDKEPYLFKSSARENVVGNLMNVQKIVGGTVAWNQYARELNSTYWRTENSTATYDNGIVTFTASARYGSVLPLENAYRPSIILGHKYLFAGMFKTAVADADVAYGLNVGNRFYFGKNDISTTDWVSIATIKSATVTALAQITLQDNSESGWGEVQGKNIMFIDLTQMFGSTIADYIYSLEQATAGAGVAFFRNLFPNDYYAYNAGELISVKTSAHVMRGFNQWDEEWEVGNISSTTGQNEESETVIRSKNYVPVIASTSYCLTCKSQVNVSGFAFFYDGNKNFISSEQQYGDASDHVLFTTPANAHYVRFRMSAGYGTSYNHDICINLSKTTGSPKNGDYVPYEKHSYPLDSDLELRGIPKLDSNNKLYYDGDEYEPSGTVTRKYGIVDLGTLTWQYNVDNQAFYSNAISALKQVGTYGDGNIVCHMYVYHGVTSSQLSDKEMMYAGQRIYIKNTAYTDIPTFTTAMSGVYLVYELATPTTETADTYDKQQVFDVTGTEEYVDTRSVPIPVGHDTFFPTSLTSRIDALEDEFNEEITGLSESIAPTETSPATQTHASGTYIMYQNRLYKVIASIAVGETLTVGTNIQATTIMAELLALTA